MSERDDSSPNSAPNSSPERPAAATSNQPGAGALSLPTLWAQPRVRLAHLPTPLEPQPRLAAALAASCDPALVPTIYIKRDDCTGLATGGNKTRKLEYLIGAAQAAGATTVITFGALQSNHARQTAAACASQGLACELILTARVDGRSAHYDSGSNLLLDTLLGARIHRLPGDQPTAIADCLRDRRAALAAAGETVYVIPTGGSSAVGALGYVNCGLELLGQCAAIGIAPDAVVHATSSGGTQAGLMVGVRSQQRDLPIIGINVYERDHVAHRANILALTTATAELLAVPEATAVAGLTIEQGYMGADYGQPSAAMHEAVHTTAAQTGLLLDPVYSGKAMAGLFGMIRGGRFNRDQTVVFIHTGGAAALDAYLGELLTR